jgi:virginiamycin A acetyltransferase
MKLFSVQSIISDIKKYIAKKRKYDGKPLIINSVVTNVGLVHASASVSNSEIYGETTISENAILNSVYIKGRVRIGKYTAIEGPSAVFTEHQEVIIGKYCSIAWGCNIINYNHYLKRPSSHYMMYHVFGKDPKRDVRSKGPIEIGNDVWIGANVIILSGVKIGHGAVLAAGSIIVGDVDPYSIVSGNPAIKIGARFEEATIQKLLDLSWWDWEEEKMKRNVLFFEADLDFNLICE